MGYTWKRVGAMMQDPEQRDRARAIVEAELKKHGNDPRLAAAALEVSWGTFYAWMRKLGIAAPVRERAVKRASPKKSASKRKK